MQKGIRCFPVNGIQAIEDKQKNLPAVCTCGKKECTKQGKHPLPHVRWVKDATTCEQKFTHSLLKEEKFSNVNYAVVTGEENRENKKFLVVVDIDSAGLEHPIIKQLDSLVEKTFSYITGSGGRHYWYWSTKEVFCSQALVDKVDIRGTNGYVIVPPSQHKSGNSYRFDGKEIDFENVSLIESVKDIPEFIMALIEERAKGKPSLSGTSGKTTKYLTPIQRKEKRIHEAAQESLSGFRTTDSKKKKTKYLSAELSDFSVGENITLGTRQTLTFSPAWWSSVSVPEMLKALENDKVQIPVGVRNSILHKLLASARGKGVYLKTEIEDLAEKYVARFEDPSTFSNLEMAKVCGSVMKYASYSQDANSVNASYVRWLASNHGIEVSLSELEELDNKFFSRLIKQEKSPKKSKKATPKYTSLERLAELREMWYMAQKHQSHATYKSQLLAKKLISLGFEKQRTAKFNVWLIDVSLVEQDIQTAEETFKKEIEANLLKSKKNKENFDSLQGKVLVKFLCEGKKLSQQRKERYSEIATRITKNNLSLDSPSSHAKMKLRVQSIVDKYSQRSLVKRK